jgi:LacI family transcriptional regulator
MGNSKRATIKEVAKSSGVSIQTVSRVINHHPDVAPKTRERILEVIDQLGYRPNELARGLINKRTNTIGVVTAGLRYIGPSFTLNGITGMAEEKGYAILLEEISGFHINDVTQRLYSLLTRHVDGIIWAVPEIGNNRDWLDYDLKDLPVPIEFLTMEPREGVSIVSYDNFKGGWMATHHLIASGYKKIGLISGPLDWWEARQRKQGWEVAIKEAGLELADNQWIEGNWSSSSGEKAFHILVEKFPEMDAVFASNDQMAYGIFHAAYRLGIKIPLDLGVVGFDGLAESAYIVPPLTTVYQDLNYLGRTAVNCLVSAIDRQQSGDELQFSEPLILTPELIERESS